MTTARASVTIYLNVGQLETATGVPLPNGSLIQLLVDTGGDGFTTPTSTSFTGGSTNDDIIASFAMNSSSTGVTGDFLSSAITFSLGTNNLAANDSILLRWWPTLTTSSTAPGTGASYGQFSTTAVVDGASSAWVTQADGSDSTLVFETASQGGSQANSAGVASSKVVPEPGTFALTAFGVAAMLAARKSRKRRD